VTLLQKAAVEHTLVSFRNDRCSSVDGQSNDMFRQRTCPGSCRRCCAIHQQTARRTLEGFVRLGASLLKRGARNASLFRRRFFFPNGRLECSSEDAQRRHSKRKDANRSNKVPLFCRAHRPRGCLKRRRVTSVGLLGADSTALGRRLGRDNGGYARLPTRPYSTVTKPPDAITDQARVEWTQQGKGLVAIMLLQPWDRC
jgi:hypothetical protein